MERTRHETVLEILERRATRYRERGAYTKKQQQQENAYSRDDKKKYNSLGADVDVTEEDMEAYRLRKGRGTEDPLANLGDELLEYK